MTEFPRIDGCLICEGARAEIGGKLTLLGFYGAAPNVQITLSNPAVPLTIMIIFEGFGGHGRIDGTVDLANAAGEVQATKPFGLYVDPERPKSFIGAAFSEVLQPGTVSILMRFGERTPFRSSFELRWGSVPQES